MRSEISLLLPTRHRVSLINRLFNSIIASADNPAALEIVLYIDEDDKETQDISFQGLSLIKLIGPRETMGKMTNLCYEASHGHFVMLMNDDVIFRTNAWDQKVKEAFLAFKDSIAMVYGNDLYQRGCVGTFPILSRVICEAMGGICPPEYKYSHIDTHLFDIFRKLAALGYKRNVYLSEVIFEHMHYEAGKSLMDEIYREKDSKEDELAYISWEDERRWIANRLAQYIEKGDSALF